MTPGPGKLWEDGPGSWTLRATMWRVGASIALPIVWLSATLLFYAFFATGLSILQDVVVGVVAVLTLLAAMILVWISFGFRLARHWVDG